MRGLKLLTFLFVSLLVCHDKCFSLDTAEKKVGVILPLSGPLAIVGEAIRNAIELTREQGGFDKVVFKFEDDQFNPRNSVSAVKKFIEIDGINGLIVFGSGPSLAIADYVEQNKIPTFAMAYSDDLTKGRTYVYRTFLTATSQASAIKEELNKKNYSSLGVITSTNEAMVVMRNAVDKVLPYKPVIDLQIEPSELDLKLTSTKIMSKNPQALFILLVPPQISILSQSLRSKNWQGTFFSSSHLNNPSEIAASKGSLKGSWLVTIDDSRAAQFHELYKGKYSKNAVVDGTIATDVASLLVTALGEKNFNEYLDDKDSYLGTYGTWKKTSEHTFEPPTKIKEILE